MNITLIPKIEKVEGGASKILFVETVIIGMTPAQALGTLSQALVELSAGFILKHPKECQCGSLDMAKATYRAIAEIQREFLERSGLNPADFGWLDPMKNTKQDPEPPKEEPKSDEVV